MIRLGLVSLFADVSSEMLYPLTPIFMTTILGATMLQVGLTEAVAESLASILKLYAGRWSDRMQNRRFFVWFGYLLTALAKPLVGISQNWMHVWGARALDRSGKGLRTAPRDALLAESVEPKNRGLAFGWHRGMDSLGAVAGPLITIAGLAYYRDSLRELYFWALIPGLVAVLFVFSVDERAPSQKSQAAGKEPHLADFSSNFKHYLFVWSIFSIANSSDAFLILKAKSSGLSMQTVIVLYALFNLTQALASPFLGGLSDRIDRRRVLIGGLLVFAAVYAGFAYAQTTLQFALLFAIYGIYLAATDGAGKALCVDLVPKESKATGLGYFAAATGVASLVSSVVAGLMWDKWGASVCFLYGAAGAVIAALGLATKVQVQPKK